MRTSKTRTRSTAIGVLAAGMMVLVACQKESQQHPSHNALGKAAQGGAKAYGGAQMYALVAGSGGSGLVNVNTTLRSYSPLCTIEALAPATPGRVDHFKGISWDPMNNCTWLVTDGTPTIPSHRNILWKVLGPLPMVPSAPLGAHPVARLRTMVAGSAVTVTDARDIERDPISGTLYLLRTDGQFATLGLGGIVTNLPNKGSNAHAFTFDCAGRLMAIKASLSPAPFFEVNKTSGIPVLGSGGLSTSLWHPSEEAGMEPAFGTCDLFVVNADVPLNMMSLTSPSVCTTHPSLVKTMDMTSM